MTLWNLQLASTLMPKDQFCDITYCKNCFFYVEEEGICTVEPAINEERRADDWACRHFLYMAPDPDVDGEF